MHLLETKRSRPPDAAGSSASLSLTQEEFDLVVSAIRAVLDDFEYYEFQTRVGQTVETARSFLASLATDATGSNALDSAGRPVELEGEEEAGVLLSLSVDELRLVKNALNEVLNGIGVAAVVNRFGEERINALMDALDSVLRDLLVAGTRGSSSAIR
jgi:hypothetical protein